MGMHFVVLVSKKYYISTFLFKETPCEGRTHLLRWNNRKYIKLSRSQWLRGLMHEMHDFASPARILGSWVRISLEAWMFVYVYFVFMLSCVGSGLATAWSLVLGVLPTVYKIKKLKETKRFTDALCSRGSNRNMNEWMNIKLRTDIESRIKCVHYFSFKNLILVYSIWLWWRLFLP
jgi:hypothetical protein